MVRSNLGKSTRKGFPVGWRVGLAALALAACTQEEAPMERALAPASPQLASQVPARLAEVRLALPEVERGSRAADRQGVILGLYELGLTDLAGVVPRVGGAPVSLGLTRALTAGAESWEARVDVLAAQPLELAVTLCDEHRYCTEHWGQGGSLEQPAIAVAALLKATARRMGRVPLNGSDVDWETVGSKDAYAVLLAGRSAAVRYGLRDPAPAGTDPRRDPVARAVFIDPELPLAAWMAARRDADEGLGRAARGGFARAAVKRPRSAVLLADEAGAAGLSGEALAAWGLWREVEARAPGDPRFTLAVAAAALDAGEAREAWRRSQALPAWAEGAPEVAALRVRAAEILGDQPDFDALLRDWQWAAPANPEPVEKRIELRVEAGQFSEAARFLDTLAGRGRPQKAGELRVALAAAQGQWAEAEAAADAMGWASVAGRARTRRAEIAGETPDLRWLKGDYHPESRLRSAGSPLAGCDELRAVLPGDPRVRALCAAAWGDEPTRAAEEAQVARALWPDPVPYWGSSAAPGATETGVQAQGPRE